MINVPHILIVDDNPRMLDSLSILLQSEGYIIETAQSGRKALEYISHTTFDLILLDILMPHIDGFQVMDQLNGQKNHTLVIIMTAQASVDFAIKALRSGAYDFLRIPFDPEELLTTVKNAINQQMIKKSVEYAQESLLLSESRFHTLVETTSDWIWEVDLNGVHTYASPKVKDILGYDADEVIGTKLFDFFSENNKGSTKSFFKKLGKQLKPLSGQRVTLRHKNGQLVEIEINGAPVFDKKGRLSGWQGFNRDITSRVRAEEALKESEERYRQLANSLPQVVFEVDENSNLTFVNNLGFYVFGFSEDDLEKGLHALQMISPIDRERARENMQRLLKGEKVNDLEYTMQRKDGLTYPAMIYSSPIIQEQKAIGLRGIVVDLSDVKRAQKALRESEKKLSRSKKMESIGLMAGGIAHDLNNILSGIVSYPELLLMDLPIDSPFRKPIRIIQESGQRAADVVSDLLTVARGVATSKEVKNLNDIVRKYIHSIEHKKIEANNPSVSIKLHLEPDLLNIFCSPVHINKSIMNLVANASEAIEGKGTITISTENRYLDESLKGYENICKGEYVVLLISDDGVGVSAEDLDRIFEPFYTKKEMGRSGTGLGLAVVWNTVQDHGGYINVRALDKGTVFEIYLPVSRKEADIETHDTPLENYLGTGERILVVDDEEGQRDIACRLLRKLEYTAEAVSSGEEALKYLKDYSVDLVVLDMIMPKGLSGRETYEKILKTHPAQKAIITSGFAETEDVKITQSLGAGKYIKKPYTMKKIGLAIKEEFRKLNSIG